VALGNRQRWHVIDPTVREDFDFLSGRIGDAELNIVSQDLAMEQLVILAARSDAAGEYLLYNRNARDLRLLFKTRSDLDGVPLRPMRSVAIDARDGLTEADDADVKADNPRRGVKSSLRKPVFVASAQRSPEAVGVILPVSFG
jgi:hypothetical protein